MSVKVTVDLLKSEDIRLVGCRICGGKLVPALYMSKRGEVERTFTHIGHSHAADRFLACDGEGAFVSVNGLDFVRLIDAQGKAFFTEDVSKGEPRAVLVCGEKCLTHTGKSYVSYTNPYGLSCGAVHCGRLFGIDADNKYILRWSAIGVNGWEEGLKGSGNLVLDPVRGEGLNIVPLGGRLAVVRRFGLTFLKMYGSPENFSVSITDTDCEEVYENTARTVSGNLYFYTASGLRRYDGNVIKTVNHRFSDEIASPVCAETYGGKYFLSCALKDGTRSVLVYDPEDGESYLIDGAADCMCAADGIYAYAGTGAYKLASGGGYTFTAGGLCFGTDGDKTLLSLKLNGAGADVTVSNGRQTQTFVNARGVIRPRLKGQCFTVKVKGTNAVRSLEATAEVANEI